MQGLVTPLVEQGTKHKEQFVHNIHSLNDHESRIALIEYSIFKSDKSEDRFEQVLRKISEMKEKGIEDITELRSDWVKHKNELQAISFSQDKKLERVDKAEQVVQGLADSYKKLEERFQWHTEETETLLNKSLNDFRERLTISEGKTRENQEELHEHMKRLDG